VRNALEPQWEARFEARSYGFRPGRGCHDAIEAVFQTASGKGATRLWCLDFDLEAAFDHIDHDHLLSLLAGFPGLGLVRKWLKAGVVENGVLSPTEEGTPQGRRDQSRAAQCCLAWDGGGRGSPVRQGIPG
jgi:RNA-directed DNA polymerase